MEQTLPKTPCWQREKREASIILPWFRRPAKVLSEKQNSTETPMRSVLIPRPIRGTERLWKRDRRWNVRILQQLPWVHGFWIQQKAGKIPFPVKQKKMLERRRNKIQLLRWKTQTKRWITLPKISWVVQKTCI